MTMTSVTYQVTGMTCAHCAHAVSGELGSVPGVSAVAVDLVPGGASAVTVTSDAPLTVETVSAALDEAGDYRLAEPGPSDADRPAPGRTLPVL
jgi:copper chaperone